ncbi:MAG: haloacid dehalogenase type II [Phycisphaerales bacterium]
MKRLSDFDALTFDCYGTLIDWESGILDALATWRERSHLDATDEEVLSAFAELEPAAERDHPDALYPDVLRVVAARMAERYGAPATDDDADRLAGSVGRWPAFADTVGALQRLKRRRRLIILSNVDHASFSRTRNTLGVEFDAVVTAQDVGAYKPDARMFHAAFDAAERLGVERGRILHVAQSLYHDHEPAKRLGMTTCFIDRRAGRPGGATRAPSGEVQPDFTFTTLADFADAVEEANSAHG